MQLEYITQELCPLGYSDRIQRCRELLQDPRCVGEVRRHVLYFLCHAYIQPEIDAPHEALALAEQALTEDLSPDLWGKFVVAKGLALYQLGRLSDLPAIAEAILQASVMPIVLAHAWAFKGVYLSWLKDSAAFGPLKIAADMFGECGSRQSRAWMQRSAASLALKLGQPEVAIEWARTIDFKSEIPAGKLLEAEALFYLGLMDESKRLVCEVIDGVYGDLAGDTMARCHYLQALHAMHQGNLLAAGEHLVLAGELLARQRRQSIDLASAIAALRIKLLEGREVQPCGSGSSGSSLHS